MTPLRRLTSWFIVDDPTQPIHCTQRTGSGELAEMRAARDCAVRETLHAERQVRDLCEALDATEALLRHVDRTAAHYRLGWQMGAPFVDYDEVHRWPGDPVHPDSDAPSAR